MLKNLGWRGYWKVPVWSFWSAHLSSPRFLMNSCLWKRTARDWWVCWWWEGSWSSKTIFHRRECIRLRDWLSFIEYVRWYFWEQQCSWNQRREKGNSCSIPFELVFFFTFWIFFLSSAQNHCSPTLLLELRCKILICRWSAFRHVRGIFWTESCSCFTSILPMEPSILSQHLLQEVRNREK